MISLLKEFWKKHPLICIIIIAFMPRLIAVFFSRGYGMHDDHFGPIEQPFQIMHDITYWTGRGEPHGHSIVYPSIHYALFNGFEAVGIADPQNKMLIVRFLHALYSLVIVISGYKIAEILSDRETAKKAGIILALFWAFPFLSVRNLIEMVCIPPLMAGFFFILESREKLRNAFIAGLWFGLAFVFRYQTLSITGTLVLILVYRKEFRQIILFAIGFIVVAVLIQGTADVFAWGYPFASFREYLRYNVSHGYDYTTGSWYNYALLILGAFIPPVSLFLLYGFIKNWKKTILIFLPIMVFFVLHSYFPNKQERFIFPVFPLILLLSVIGWEEYIKKSLFWKCHRLVLRSMWIWFWAVNIILLVPFTIYYSKKSRVEAMYSLYGKQINGIVMVGGELGVTQPPLFYAGKYPVPIYQIDNNEQLARAKTKIDEAEIRPNFTVIFGPEDIEQRAHNIESSLGFKLVLERRIEASFLDDVFYRLNPRYNKNQTTFVYRNKF